MIPVVLLAANQLSCVSSCARRSAVTSPLLLHIPHIILNRLVLSFACVPITTQLSLRRAQVQPGKKCAVLGAGPIGLIVAMVAAAFGADAIAITDVSTTKLDFASQHCPRVQPLLINPNDSPTDVAEQLQQCCFAGASPEVVIDCAGFQQTLETGLRVVKEGGVVVLVGMGQEHMSIPAALLTVKEVDLLGSFR